MNARTLCVAGVGLAAVLLSACAVEGSGYGPGYGGYGVDYYDAYPGPYDYGGWGPDYYVGPVWSGGHDHDRDRDRGGGHEPGRPGGEGHGYRPAPAGRPVPSLPRGRGHAPAGHAEGGGRGGEHH